MIKRMVFFMFIFAAGVSTARELPLFDAHIHYSRQAWEEVTPRRVFEILDEAGVSKALVSSTPDSGTLTLFETRPDRVVPFLRLYRTSGDPGLRHGERDLIAYLEKEIDRGIYRGIGEVHLDAGDAGAPVVERVAAIAARDGLLVQVHTDEKGMEELVSRYPDVRFIWAHAGLSTPASGVGRLLGLTPNLWTELSLRSDVAPGGVLDPEWRGLFVGFPDRFLVGTDTWVNTRWGELVENAEFTRNWLGQLPSGVAEKIAYLNGESLFGETR
jgi:predicted TIM-barrel fold metal-dependent hydrolase